MVILMAGTWIVKFTNHFQQDVDWHQTLMSKMLPTTRMITDVEINLIYKGGKTPDFYRNHPAIVQTHRARYRQKIQNLQHLITSSDMKQQRLLHLKQIIEEKQVAFFTLLKTLHTMGYKDWGIVGTFRKAIRQLEKQVIAQQQPHLTAQILLMRRHEKDYLLRGEAGYAEKLDQAVAVFRQQLQRFESSDSAVLLELLALYQNNFKEFTRLQVHALDPDQGLLVKYRQLAQTQEKHLIETLQASIEHQESDVIKHVFLLAALLIVSLILSQFVFSRLNRNFYQPMLEISRATHGNTDIRLDVKGDGHISNLSQSFNELLKQFNLNSKQLQLQKYALDATNSVIITDSNGVITYANDLFCYLSNYPLAELVGQPMAILKSGHHSAIFYQQLWEKIKAGNIVHEEIKNRRKDGRYYWVDAFIVPTEIDAEPGKYNYTSIQHDITVRKQLEAEKESMQIQLFEAQRYESIGHLAGGVAHEFNNILAGVIGYASSAKKRIITGRTDQALIRLDKLITSAMSGAKVTAKLLGYARKGNYEIADIDLKGVISGCIQETSAFNPGIKYDVNVGPTLGAFAGDRQQIKQLVLNLLANAREAITHDGHIIIDITNQRFDTTAILPTPNLALGPYIQLTIKDNGQGIDAANMASIFDPFYSTKETGRGTGLGLAMIKGIVESLQGEIQVTSIKGVGTEFKIYFPAATQEEIQAPQQKTV